MTTETSVESLTASFAPRRSTHGVPTNSCHLFWFGGRRLKGHYLPPVAKKTRKASKDTTQLQRNEPASQANKGQRLFSDLHAAEMAPSQMHHKRIILFFLPLAPLRPHRSPVTGRQGQRQASSMLQSAKQQGRTALSRCDAAKTGWCTEATSQAASAQAYGIADR